MSIEWFRWYHNTTSDPKFQVIARRSKRPKCEVIAVWACLLEYTSQEQDRGSLAGLDHETIAATVDIDDESAEAIIAAMEAKGLISDGRIAAWDRRQTKREDDSLDRVRAYRERKKEIGNASVTQGNAPVTPVTPLDKIREDIDTNTPPSFFSETPPASARVAESMPEPPKKEKKADEWNRDSRNKPIPADWEPQSATLDITAGLGIPIGFVENQAPLFRLHHMEAGTQRGGFESLFVGWCKKAWALKAEERSPGERRKGETMLEHSQRLRRMYLEPDQPGERLLEGEVIRAH